MGVAPSSIKHFLISHSSGILPGVCEKCPNNRLTMLYMYSASFAFQFSLASSCYRHAGVKNKGICGTKGTLKHHGKTYQSSVISTSIFKKQTMDTNFVNNYQPISNLPYLFRPIAFVIAEQIFNYMFQHGLDKQLQSAYQKPHFTETTIAPCRKRPPLCNGYE